MPRIPASAGNIVLDLQASQRFLDPDRRYRRGKKLVRRGLSFRKAAARVGVPPSTLWYRYNHEDKTKPAITFGRSLTLTEEERICTLLKRYAFWGKPLNRDDLKDAVQMLVQDLPAWRRSRIRFRNSRPGDKFCRAFEKRHSDKITYSAIRREDAVRYRATNGECLTTHFARIEHIIQEHDIDAKRIVNVDETGVSAWNERNASKKKSYSLRGGKPFVPDASFKNVNRISILASVFGNGDHGRPLFVFQGKRIRVRTVTLLRNGEERSECIADMLPRNSLIHTKTDVASIDSWNFLDWSNYFIRDTEDLRVNGRRMLLIYDGYRSHLSIRVLEKFRLNNIIAYSLPSHTSGTTQPLDVTVFPAFKNRFRNLSQSVSKGVGGDRVLDEFDVCKLLSTAYEDSFTSDNIKGGFRATGICPLDEYRLFAQARPYSIEDPTRVASVEDVMKMLDERSKASSLEILGEVKLTKSGFLDTSLGAVVTSARAIQLLKQQEEKRKNQREKRRAQELEASARDAKVRIARRESRRKFEESRAEYRATRYDEPVVFVRTLRERASLAKVKFATAHNERVARLVLQGFHLGD